LASRAIEECLDVQEWQVKAIEDAIREADSPTAVFHEHEEVEARLKKLTAKRRRTK
jgi:predicted transcriptional regulator